MCWAIILYYISKLIVWFVITQKKIWNVILNTLLESLEKDWSFQKHEVCNYWNKEWDVVSWEKAVTTSEGSRSRKQWSNVNTNSGLTVPTTSELSEWKQKSVGKIRLIVMMFLSGIVWWSFRNHDENAFSAMTSNGKRGLFKILRKKKSDWVILCLYGIQAEYK